LQIKASRLFPSGTSPTRTHHHRFEPSVTRAAAEAAVRELCWKQPYHLDADHIRLETVDRFIPYADFFTIDVPTRLANPPSPGA